MKQIRLLTLLVLLAAVVSGAWAQSAFTAKEITSESQLTSTDDEAYVAACMPSDFLAVDVDVAKAWTGAPTDGRAILIYAIDGDNIKMAGFLNGSYRNANGQTWSIAAFKNQMANSKFYYTAASPYSVTMKSGTQDADKWTASTDGTNFGALPIGGLKGDGSETVTLQYNGRMKVKGVKATSDEAPAAPSFTEVTTFSELQTALSAGKNVKLKNDIVCTAQISITSDVALTIDGNGKKLSTTSAIRAFMVGSSATVAFKDLTLTGFVSGGGPAINNSGTIVLDGCTISNCHVNNNNGGGAIENKSSNGKLYAINTTFSGNYSGEIGGAINNYMGSLYMSGCTFTNNYTTKSDAYYGGAIGINRGSEVRLINCAFSGNKYGTNTGTNDIGVYSKPTNYTIAGCTGATIASANDITTNASGTATLDYSDLSNISFTYNAE